MLYLDYNNIYLHSCCKKQQGPVERETPDEANKIAPTNPTKSSTALGGFMVRDLARTTVDTSLVVRQANIAAMSL